MDLKAAISLFIQQISLYPKMHLNFIMIIFSVFERRSSAFETKILTV